MEFLFDSADLAAIEKYGSIVPYTGVTTNPSILKAAGKIDFFPHIRALRRLIGEDRSLHIQLLADNHAGMLREAEAVLAGADDKVYIKIPTTEEGLKAMQMLVRQGVNVTATAVYTRLQAYMAMNAGVHYIAPYFNRMENRDIDATSILAEVCAICRRDGYRTKIVAASFKNLKQINAALAVGVHAVTAPPALYAEIFSMEAIGAAVEGFKQDWTACQGGASILDLPR